VENLHPILKVYPAMLAAASKWVPSHGQSGSIGQLGYRMKMDKFDLPEDRVPKNHIILYIIIIFPLICAILGFWTERIDHYQKPPEAKDSATTPHFFPWDKAARFAIRLSRRSQGTAQGCNMSA
jgi:hypothetical protein